MKIQSASVQELKLISNLQSLPCSPIMSNSEAGDEDREQVITSDERRAATSRESPRDKGRASPVPQLVDYELARQFKN